MRLGFSAAFAGLTEEAIEVARSSGNGSMLGWVLLARSSAATACGEPALALRTAQESVAAHLPATNTLPGVWSRLALAVALADEGETAAAEQLIDLGSLPAPLRPGAQELLVRCRLAAGRVAEAAASATGSDRALAAVALHQGRPREAGALALSATGTVQEEAAGRFLAARALAAAGDVEAAVGHLEIVCDTYARIGAPRRRAEAERLLRKLGRRRSAPRSGPAAGLAGLTTRELEIARLVTDRRTNAEIAGDLYLSTKTVETHIRNLFHKLAFSSRVEIARAVERHDREAP